ncbi:MAG: CRISPR-associated helicase Cas3' [Bacteroidota bacterium]
MLLFKSFKELSDENIGLENIFETKNEFFAHTHNQKQQETLHEHLHEVKKYFNIITDVNQLESIIDKLISKISFEDIQIGNHIKLLFFHSIVFHDFGKINPNFQVERMQNNFFESDNTVKIGYEHSYLSAYLFLTYHFKRVFENDSSSEQKSILWYYSFIFSIPILKHHSAYISKDYNFEESKINTIYKFHEIVEFDIIKDFSNNFFKNENRLIEYFQEFIQNKTFDFFPLFALLKLNYSLLTASDYYATSQYMNDLKFSTEEDFGLITNDLKQRIFNHFETNEKTSYNGELTRNCKKYLNTNIADLQEKSNANLNILRQKLGAEVLLGIEKHSSDKVFYIEAPTGGGKTNMSMIAIYKMLKLFPEINKVFYVFPFTTLITQTDKAIKETLGLTNIEVTQVHSKSGFQTKTNDNNEVAKYGNDLKNQIDNLFVNYPFTLLTHIKFFDILKSNKKDTNYLLHRLANSIVIIDELQTYNPSEWDKIKYYISNYAKLFNIRFVIMSATLPKIGNIAIGDEEIINFQPLIKFAQEDYLCNPNFANRVSIKTDLLDKKIELHDLADILIEKSKEYAENRSDEYKGSIHTIIEFIFKKSASEFYDILKEKNDFFDDIFVLSGTILEPRRKYIIEYLKDKQNKKRKILLISTQVVEAGVDIDMDLGFKNQSLIDSDEQLAGRINRNINKENCEMWLFKHDKAKSIYGKDLRYEVTQNFSNEFVFDILSKKDFKLLYEKVFEKIEMNNKSAYKENFNDYKHLFEKLNFEQIHREFKLIDSENASIFIPMDIDIFCYGNENNFSKSELDFILEHKCFSNDNNDRISGDKIWEIYASLIQNKDLNFTLKNIQIKILNGIMSKFVFSIFMRKANDLKKYCKYNKETGDFVNYNFFKFEKEYIGEGKIYDFHSGINEELLAKELKQPFEFI